VREVRDAGSRRRRAYNWSPREFQPENRTLSLYKATPNRGALLGFGAECKEAHLTIRHAFLNFLNKKLCGDRFSIFPILVSDSFGLAL
jgi:hypothetical protein